MSAQFEKQSARCQRKKEKREQRILKQRARELRTRYQGWWCVAGVELADHTPDWAWFKTQEQAEQIATQAINTHFKLKDDEGYETTLDGFFGVQCLPAEQLTLEEYSTFAEQDAVRQSCIAAMKTPVIPRRP